MKLDEIILTDVNEKKPCKTLIKNFYILIAFLLITVAVSIYCYLIKYQAKQGHLLPFQFNFIKFEMSNKFKDRDLENYRYYF